MSTEAMTAQEARTFEHHSRTNAEILRKAVQERGCSCVPYEDWYTYVRWQAQGYQVRKGEHGVRLTTFKTVREKDEETGEQEQYSIPRRSYVFCRCQVDGID